MQFVFDFKVGKLCKFCEAVINRKSSHYKKKVFCTMKCRGLFLSEETKGEKHPNYSNGKAVKQKYNCNNCKKDFVSDKGYDGRTPKYCSKECSGKGLIIERPIKICKECDKNFQEKHFSIGQIFCSNECSSVDRGRKLYRIKRPNFSGKNSSSWKGGVTPINELARKGVDYKIWRVSVFLRDDFTCQICKVKGGKLNADHIKSFAHHKELRFDINNGRTLCEACHKKTDNYGSKAKKNES